MGKPDIDVGVIEYINHEVGCGGGREGEGRVGEGG